MQSLSAMLSPLRTDEDQQGHTAPSNGQASPMDFQTPLSITIPDEVDMDLGQGFGNDQLQNNQSWQPIMYAQQPLLLSKSPEDDRLTLLNMEVGNKYTYQVLTDETPGGLGGFYDNQLGGDPRIGTEQWTYHNSNESSYTDPYYKCAYQPVRAEPRALVRHKLEDDDMGPDAKRSRVCEDDAGADEGAPNGADQKET